MKNQMTGIKGCFLLAIVICLPLASKCAAQESANPTGAWKWSFTTQNGDTIQASAKLKRAEGDKLTGIYVRNGTETPIEEGQFKDGNVSFKVNRERDGQKFTAKYQGKVSGDTIKGKIETVRDGETRTRDWEAKREKESSPGAASVIGTWTWTVKTQNGETFEPRMKLKQQGGEVTGVVIWNGTETPISDGKVEDDTLSFKVVRDREGRTVTSKYLGRLTGGIIKGKVESNWSGENQTFDWEAKRVEVK